MKTKLAFFVCVLLVSFTVSCTKNSENKEPDPLDGIYVDGDNLLCLMIHEYEDGKLGYYIFDKKNGLGDFTRSYLMGKLTIGVDGNDSTIIFKEIRNEAKSGSRFPYFYGGLKAKIKNTPDYMCLLLNNGNRFCFGRMNSNKFKEMIDANRLFMYAYFKDKEDK